MRVAVRDAVLFYEKQSCANAVVLCAFAREELGRSRILLDLWRNSSRASIVTIKDVEAAVKNHVEKQRAGMFSLTMRADSEGELAKILRIRRTESPQSKKWQDADAKLKTIDAEMAERTPRDRHAERMSALYVEPKSTTEWNRPADKSVKEAYEFLVDAINDYRARYQSWYFGSPADLLQHNDPELYSAFKRMSDRPTLPVPIDPSWPSGA
jgi:AbiV family abortive infection protein